MRNENSLIITYLTLRKIIGILGISLPFMLSIGALVIFQTGIQRSISSYYYTGMGDLFVGTIFIIGFFLLAYKGYEIADEITGDIGCGAAIGLALFPTAPDGVTAGVSQVVGYLHLGFTATFFLTLIYFSLFLFTKTAPDKPPTKRKLQRNRVYRTCGFTMAACILLITLYLFLPVETAAVIDGFYPVFWLEAVAIVAFGISWLIKGEALLKDK